MHPHEVIARPGWGRAPPGSLPSSPERARTLARARNGRRASLFVADQPGTKRHFLFGYLQKMGGKADQSRQVPPARAKKTEEVMIKPHGQCLFSLRGIELPSGLPSGWIKKEQQVQLSVSSVQTWKPGGGERLDVLHTHLGASVLRSDLSQNTKDGPNVFPSKPQVPTQKKTDPPLESCPLRALHSFSTRFGRGAT